jgi:Sulfotransferase family
MDVFIHIPKTAGSTIRSIISRQYGTEGVLYFEPTSTHWPAGLSPQAFLDRECRSRNVNLITGHHQYGMHEYTRTKTRYFSMVRDPISRELSNYYYAFSYPEHLYREQIKSGRLTPEDFLRIQAQEISNSQAYLLSGPYRVGNSPRLTALHNVESEILAVGISERFDESLLYIAKTLGWRPPIYSKKNVTRLDPDRQAARAQSDAHCRKEFAHLLTDDYSVYDLANHVMNQWIEGEGGNRGKTPGTRRQAGCPRQRMRSGRCGTVGPPNTPSLSPR